MININIDPAVEIARIPRYLYGAGLEDVNHEVYGGISSQMIFGESFEEDPLTLGNEFEGIKGSISCIAEREYLAEESEIRSWQPVRRGNARGRLKATQLRARLGCRSQKIEFIEGEGAVGIENRGPIDGV